MIEKFTAEELRIIKKELGVSEKTMGSKSFILSDQKSRIMKLMAGTKKKRAGKEVWDALLIVCDYTTGNLQDMGGMAGFRGRGETYHRYASIFGPKLQNYRALMDEMLDVIEKHRKGDGDEQESR